MDLFQETIDRIDQQPDSDLLFEIWERMYRSAKQYIQAHSVFVNYHEEEDEDSAKRKLKLESKQAQALDTFVTDYKVFIRTYFQRVGSACPLASVYPPENRSQVQFFITDLIEYKEKYR